MRVAKYDKVFHPDNTEQQKAFPRLPLITSWAIPFDEITHLVAIGCQ